MDIAVLIASIDARTPPDEQRLVDGLVARAWPGGHADHRRPGAAEWVRRWGPGTPGPSPLDDSRN